MKKLKQKFIKIIALIITFYSIVFSVTPKNVQATENVQNSDNGARDTFVQNLINFQSSEAGKCHYSVSGRERTYAIGYPASSYIFDCVGWVSFAFHCLGPNLGGPTFEAFVDPTPNYQDQNDIRNYINNPNFVRVEISQITPGDVLVCKGQHVGIYVGNNMIIHMTIHGLRYKPINDYGYTWDFAAHLTKFGDVPPLSESSDGPGWVNDFRPQGEIDQKEVDLDEKIFEFAGNPSKVKYTNPGPIKIQWLFSKLSQFVDYILGIALTGLKGAIVGWTSIIESWINSAFRLLSGK